MQPRTESSQSDLGLSQRCGNKEHPSESHRKVWRLAWLRDAGLLESAVLRAENKVNFDPEATVQTVAASLSFGLIKNHAFIDGNKRIGLAALVDFLAANGFLVAVSEGEQVDAVLRVAASEMYEAEWTAWVKRSVAPAAL